MGIDAKNFEKVGIVLNVFLKKSIVLEKLSN